MSKCKDIRARVPQDVKDYLLTNWDGNRLKRGASRDATVKFPLQLHVYRRYGEK
jgi:hypothetical protein